MTKAKWQKVLSINLNRNLSIEKSNMEFHQIKVIWNPQYKRGGYYPFVRRVAINGGRIEGGSGTGNKQWIVAIVCRRMKGKPRQSSRLDYFSAWIFFTLAHKTVRFSSWIRYWFSVVGKSAFMFDQRLEFLKINIHYL